MASINNIEKVQLYFGNRRTTIPQIDLEYAKERILESEKEQESYKRLLSLLQQSSNR